MPRNVNPLDVADPFGPTNRQSEGQRRRRAVHRYHTAIHAIARDLADSWAPEPTDRDWAEVVQANLADARTRAEQTLREFKPTAPTPAPYVTHADRVLAALRIDQPRECRQLVQETGLTERQVSAVLQKLRRNGKALTQRRNDKHLWWRLP